MLHRSDGFTLLKYANSLAIAFTSAGARIANKLRMCRDLRRKIMNHVLLHFACHLGDGGNRSSSLMHHARTTTSFEL